MINQKSRRLLYLAAAFLIIVPIILIAVILKFMTINDIKSPVAEVIPHYSEIYDGEVDNYYWLRSKNWPHVTDAAILEYLKEENAYYKAKMQQEDALSEKIFLELKGRIQEQDYTVPYRDGNYQYYSRIDSNHQYWTHFRKSINEGSVEEVLLDENELAKNKAYLAVKNIKVSPDHSLIAYMADFKGDERYTIYVIDIKTKKIIDEKVEDVVGGIEWDELGRGIFYTPAGENWNPKKVYYHELEHDQKDDQLIYQENAETFRVNIKKSSSKKYIFINAQDAESNECHLINAKSPTSPPQLFEVRRDKHLYYPEHNRDKFYILTNDTHRNFRLVTTDEKMTESKNWVEMIPPSNNAYLLDLHTYQHYLAITKRILGLAHIQLIDLRSLESQEIQFTDQVYEAAIKYTTFDADGLLYTYSSLIEPESVMEFDFLTKQTKILKTKQIPSGYNKEDYVLERVWAEAKDGMAIPISLIYRSDKFKKDGTNPLYLYGYGSYGIAVPTSFKSNIFSLLDRGFVYAIAHVRGGDELGYEWYESAKFLNKKRTFEDFIAAAEYLADQRYTKQGHIVISGGSAGGMLVGACANMRPELYKAVIAHVPFVDVLNTMLDETLPLTPGEFVEWGNPKEKIFYDYIKSYSPYDNVSKQHYPNFLITAGLSDPRVTYWEPAKWAAKLRANKLDNNLLLLKTDMDTGHGGPTGRYNFLREIAMEYTFILKVFGLTQI